MLRLREIFKRNTFVKRLAYSPDKAAELMGICGEFVRDLLRTGQPGSVKAGRRRLTAEAQPRSVPGPAPTQPSAA